MLFYLFGFMEAVPALLLIVLVLRIICRWIIFRKMGARPWLSLIPLVSDYIIYKKCWVGWPFIALSLLTIALGNFVTLPGYFNMDFPIPEFVQSVLQVLAMVCFLSIGVLLNKRLSFAFGHDLLYTLGLLLLNPIFLFMLAFSKDRYHEDRARLHGKAFLEYKLNDRNRINKLISIVATMAIVFAMVTYIWQVIMTEHQPTFTVFKNNNRIYDVTSGKVDGQGSVVYPGGDADTEDPAVRDLYFSDHKGNKETTVFVYMIGSDLEDATGSASINLSQMIDATEASPDLRFVVEAGGTSRWFTRGFKGMRTARYIIRSGRVTMLDDLGGKLSMSTPDTLADFLSWGNKEYPYGRKMLFFWNHGGGIAGFGYDKLSVREDRKMLSIPEIKSALEKDGTKYDLIGFDACLMQSLEVGIALEPYADYLLASEEGEPASGLYYTTAFSGLAKDPEMDTKKFGAVMCSSYDQALELINGYPQAGCTLSMVDLRYIPKVRESFYSYLEKLDKHFAEDRDSFIDMSTARSRAHEFKMDDQIDLLDFVEQSRMSRKEKAELTEPVEDALVVRNSASANHINGLAVYIPYDDLDNYNSKREDMIRLGMKQETKVFDDFSSIIGGQTFEKEGKGSSRYKEAPWFVDAFENYDASTYRQDIPLIRHEDEEKYDNYVIDLTEEEWENISNYELGLRMKIGKKYADMGSDNIYDEDENGHPMVGFDKTWVAINDIVVALDPGTPIVADNDTIIYTGTVDATLNFTKRITIYLQWVNVGDNEGDGEVIGYLESDSVTDNFDERGMPRGYKKFKSNSLVTFLYDWYDEDGDYLFTALGHLPTYVGRKGLTVTQKDISSEDYEYFGILYDVMNRTMETKKLKHKGENHMTP